MRRPRIRRAGPYARRRVRRRKPDDRSNEQHEREITAHITLEHLRDRRLGALGPLHELDDLAERRLLADLRDFDSQRSVDLAQIQRSFGQMEGATSAEVREQRQMLNYLMRVSQGQ